MISWIYIYITVTQETSNPADNYFHKGRNPQICIDLALILDCTLSACTASVLEKYKARHPHYVLLYSTFNPPSV